MMRLLGGLIYHNKDAATQPGMIADILDAVASSRGQAPFAGFRVIAVGQERLSRWYDVTASNIEHLKGLVRRRALCAIHFDEARKASPDSAWALSLWVGPPAGRVPEPYPFNLKLTAPWQEDGLDPFIVACKDLWCLVGSPYGFIYPGRSYREVFMELSAIPSRMLGEPLSAREELHMQWLGFWQQHDDENGRLVRTAYWGNLLGDDLVRRLGGLSSVVASAPVAVSPLAGGGAYLQVSPRPEQGPDEARRMTALADYLQPVSIGFHYREAAPPDVHP